MVPLKASWGYMRYTHEQNSRHITLQCKQTQVEDDSLLYDENGEIKETGYLDEETGEMKRPWCPATRILDHIENVAFKGPWCSATCMLDHVENVGVRTMPAGCHGLPECRGYLKASFILVLVCVLLALVQDIVLGFNGLLSLMLCEHEGCPSRVIEGLSSQKEGHKKRMMHASLLIAKVTWSVLRSFCRSVQIKQPMNARRPHPMPAVATAAGLKGATQTSLKSRKERGRGDHAF
eukprot:scaffold209163_cov18-Tisochrysis_lutea.AAC.1